MTSQNENMNFDEAIAAVHGDEPDTQTMAAAAERAWQRIQQAYADPQFTAVAETLRSCNDFRALLAERDAGTISAGRKLLLEDHLRECAACRHYSQGLAEPDAEAQKWTPAYQAASFGANWRRLSGYAAILIAAALGAFTVNYFFFASAPGVRAQIETVQGKLFVVSGHGERAAAPGMELQEGELLRTSAGSHAFVRLADGSRVEMNERVEFGVASTRRNTTIRLQRGNLIVEAAHRAHGHLYVATADCRVAVTGTVFSVNSGLKGSRVAVIEGNVDVGYGAHDVTLHPGQEVTTTSELGEVPIKDEIAWSADLDRYLALLAEFSKLKQQLEQIPMPPPRKDSALLPLLPVSTKVYASIPNLGEALSEANAVFQAQLQQSPVLQQWWTKMQADNRGPKPEEVIEKVREFSQYLGDEIVFALADTAPGKTSCLVLAEVKKPGLADFLRQQLPAGEGAVYDKQSMHAAPNTNGPLFLVRDNLLVIATNYDGLERMNQQINQGPSGFAQTAFAAQHIKPAYDRGAGMLFAADLKSMINEDIHGATAPKPTAHESRNDLGFHDLNYIIVERRDFDNEVPDNRATLAFTGQRRGIASWLAAPAPIGSLDFISADASGAVAMVIKSPAQMLNDVLSMKHNPGEEPPQFVNDLTAAFGTDFSVALDGPVLPKPSWRFVAEVNSQSLAQQAIEELVQQAATEVAKESRKEPAPTIQSSTQNGQPFYTITAHGQEIDYTYDDGYLVAGPSIALVMKSLNVHHSGNSLSKSAAFRALLPQGTQLDYSAVAYQNLAPVIQPLAGQLSGPELQNLQTIAAGSKPSAVVAYGEPDKIEVQTSSKFFGFDLNTLALGALLGNNPLAGGHARSLP